MGLSSFGRPPELIRGMILNARARCCPRAERRWGNPKLRESSAYYGWPPFVPAPINHNPQPSFFVSAFFFKNNISSFIFNSSNGNCYSAATRVKPLRASEASIFFFNAFFSSSTVRSFVLFNIVVVASVVVAEAALSLELLAMHPVFLSFYGAQGEAACSHFDYGAPRSKSARGFQFWVWG